MLTTFLVPAAILALPSGPVLAAEERPHYELRVDGLSCPFCVRGLEKRLLALPGASNLRVDLATGMARLESKEALPPESLDQAVRDAGFSPAAIRMSIPGVLGGSGDGPFLHIAQGKTVRLGTGPGFDRLQAMVASGRRVVVKGEASRTGGRWVLSVEDVQEARP